LNPGGQVSWLADRCAVSPSRVTGLTRRYMCRA
jgi:hypothetical protein